jgi:hypothetical protein
LLLTICLAAGPASADDVSFEVRPEFGAGWTIPIAWGDVDRDGDVDLAVGNLFVGGGAPPNELWVNGGSGTFTGQPIFGAAFTFALAWGDYDNDGDLDLAVGNFGQNWLFVNDGLGGFIQQNQFGGDRTIAVAWADHDLDGDLDLAVGNGILGVAQQNYLYVNNGDGTFTTVSAFGQGQTDSLAWGDYDNDGDPDLAVGNGGFGYEEQNYLYVNNGDGTFTEVPAFGVLDTATVAWADATGDGLLDLAVGNWNDGQNFLYVSQGGGSFAPQAAFGARDTNTVAWGDFDLDGDQDLVVGNGDFETADQNYLYVNNGNGQFKELPRFGLGSTDSVAWADADGDGDLDLAVGNEHSPFQNELWINEISTDRFLRLELVGRYAQEGSGFSNSDAIGARVTVYDAGHLGEPAHLRGHQQVGATGGFSSQNEHTLTFGVSKPGRVDVRILWPGSDGTAIEQCLWNLDEGSLTVVESSTNSCP